MNTAAQERIVTDEAPPLLYSAEESDAAHREWKANCGPHAIAAACAIRLETVRPCIPDYRGWMNPTQVSETLKALGEPFVLRKGLQTAELCDGICRIQWHGPWLNPGRPAAAAYRYIHYIASLDGWVLDTAMDANSWQCEGVWRAWTDCENPVGWHITHHFELLNNAHG